MGVVWYYYFLVNIKPKSLFKITSVLNWFISLSFFLVVLEIIQKWGWNIKIFCLLSFGFGSLVTELNSLPIFAIWCGICPKNLEGLSITLITGISNISRIVGECLGSLIIYVMGFEKKDYKNLWKVVLIENIYMFFILFFVFCMKFPNVKLNKEEVKYIPLENV